jgi:hypothetical protein
MATISGTGGPFTLSKNSQEIFRKDTLCFGLDQISTSAFHCSSLVLPNGEVVPTRFAGESLKYFFFKEYLIFRVSFWSISKHASFIG